MEARPFSYSTGDEDLKIAGLYDLEKTIGKGHFAVVKLARHVFTGEKVAVKVINKDKLDGVSREHLFQEVMCMKLVQHPNVVRLYEVIDTTHKLYLILELGDGGDLYDYIMKHEGGLSEVAARNIFRQIINAIAYCHKLHVVHRDLKPENVVYFEKLDLVKLTDFGFSNRFTPGKQLDTSCGSLAYSAPEILLGDSYDAPKVDIWSLGVILYMLVCGAQPFEAGTDSETLTLIMDCKYTFPSYLSQELQYLISQMLKRDPDQRLSLDQILNNEWITMNSEFTYLPLLSVPLISKENVSEEDHKEIISKMAEGNLASVESIQAAIDRNEYTYITATYFLLAERKLKRYFIEQFRRTKSFESTDSDASNASSTSGIVTRSSIRVLEQPADTTPEDTLRRFSMILEDEEEEEEEEALASLASVRLELETGAGLLSSTAENSDAGTESDASSSSGVHALPIKQRRRRQQLVSVKSSPQLLNNITEEDGTGVCIDLNLTYTGSTVVESLDYTFNRPSRPKVRPRTTHFGASPTFLHRFSRNSDILRTSNSRSSSENSDTESETKSSVPLIKTSNKEPIAGNISPTSSCGIQSNVSALVRCAPIHEEEEGPVPPLPPSSIKTVVEVRDRSESVDGAVGGKASHTHKVNSSFSLASSLTQSNFSLSSLASSLRGSKAMMDAIRGTLDQQISKRMPSGHGELSSLHSLTEAPSFSRGERSRSSATPPQGHGSNNNSVPVLSSTTNTETRVKPRLKISCCNPS